MLRTYKSISHPILNINELANYIVCDYWCNARENVSSLFEVKYIDFFKKLPVFREKLIAIYDSCRELNDSQRTNIRSVFKNHNDIENLCNGSISLIDNQLPKVVEEKMKPFFVSLYEEYSERKTLESVYNSKMDYYNELYKANRFVNCPCCSLDSFEPDESENREDFDHYLPKSIISFASVNYKNLVPLCHKCNRTYKSDVNPIKDNKTCFYPYEGVNNDINITIVLNKDIDNPIDDLIFSGIENEKIQTWDEVFSIKKRYRNRTNQKKESFIRRLKRRNRSKGETIEETCRFFIDDYQQDDDKYEDDKFLKIPIMEAILNNQEFITQLNEQNK